MFADCFDLQSDRSSAGRETPPPGPAPTQGRPGCEGGGSVGGIGVNTARAFCRGGH